MSDAYHRAHRPDAMARHAKAWETFFADVTPADRLRVEATIAKRPVPLRMIHEIVGKVLQPANVDSLIATLMNLPHKIPLTLAPLDDPYDAA